jgi:excisionase family DNA binding protein
VTQDHDGFLRPGVVLLGLADLEALSKARAGNADEDTLEAPLAGASATMSVDAAARYLGISRSHAYDLVRAGEIPHLKLGRRIVIPRRELDAMIRQGVSKQA